MSLTYAKFVEGEPRVIDHTPSGAVTGGDVIVQGLQVRIAHRDIAANELGALAVGGGIYAFPKTAGTGLTIADGVAVYWDATNHVATTTATGNKRIGTTVAAATATATVVYVLHIAN